MKYSPFDTQLKILIWIGPAWTVSVLYNYVEQNSN